MTYQGTITNVLLEIDELKVSFDGLGDYYMLIQFDTSTRKTFLRWTPCGADELGPLIEIDGARVPDARVHPAMYAPPSLRPHVAAR